jgi:hypothetical protein
MKALSRLSCIALLAGIAVPASGQYVYMRSNVNLPWGQTTNEDAMDNVFGAGAWTALYYEQFSSSYLFSSYVQFIFLEGGDSSFTAFSSFMSTYSSSLTAWLNNGGRLVIMCAPNDPLNPESVTLPDGVTLNSDAYYASAANSAYATDTSNAIFNGPNSTAYYLTGNFFSHGYFGFATTHASALMQSNLNEIVLGQDEVGAGLMVFGGLTTDNFQSPQPAAHSLLENILYYTYYVNLPIHFN